MMIPGPKHQDHTLPSPWITEFWTKSPWRWRSSRRLRYP